MGYEGPKMLSIETFPSEYEINNRFFFTYRLVRMVPEHGRYSYILLREEKFKHGPFLLVLETSALRPYAHNMRHHSIVAHAYAIYLRCTLESV